MPQGFCLLIKKNDAILIIIVKKVPMIATPICYDQFDNANEIVNLGIGKSIKFTDVTTENLSEALNEVY